MKRCPFCNKDIEQYSDESLRNHLCVKQDDKISYSHDCDNCMSLAAEVEQLHKQLSEAEFFLVEKKEIIDHMKREYEELEFEFNLFKKGCSCQTS